MSEKHVIWFPGAIYSISCYDSFNRLLFNRDKDYINFLSLLELVRYQYPFYLHAYSLTPNEIYLLIETTHVPIQDIIKKLTQQYESTFTLIDSANDFLKASKSIHLMGNRQNYRWSSYLSFISHVPNDHIVTSRILNYFPDPKMKHYRQFVEENVLSKL